MSCEHPTCTLEANTICKSHCQLSVCQQHRIEHEKSLLNEIEKQLDDLSNPIITLLNQSQCDLKQSEESRQHELNCINSLFDCHLFSIDQRLKLSKKTNELISIEREQLIKYKNGDNQLKKENYQQIQNLSNEIQNNLQKQYELNHQIRDNNTDINSWPIDKENNRSTEIEYIELSDSEDELSRYSTDVINNEQYKTINNTLTSNNNEIQSNKVKKPQKPNLALLRDVCPLTQYGIFGLNSSYNLLRLCSNKSNKQLNLYAHFTRTHRLKASIAHQLLKAIRNNCDPIETKIFPQDHTKAFVENIQCPFDDTAIKFTKKNSIPNTPCHSSIVGYSFKHHLCHVHSITKLNAKLIYEAMKDCGTISHVQFEEDLCKIIN
ncbi:unnamed protein product [Rotaria sp. Silwood2]|nr:unnamed protein product [Rotaria sp. Silwood2]CAF2720474.1 unnamed protein product [Rotaria sp. Silwood2]CAF2889555.1 unnamed protein product [Rotaria sp. Silwood2]CAF3944981.1 unnamed protein product [Rotaria sp. Silwood2]CAF3975732.1 unnamed protein product [Rotaria sp. Silwood2]